MDKKGPFNSQALCEKSSQCNSISNRSELLETPPIAKNSVDIIPRGINPDKIQDCVLWWYGPSVLQNNPVVSPYDISEINDNDLYLPEFKKSDPVCLITQNVELLPIINKCSSFVKLKRILAWCLRFKENAKNPSSQRTIGSLTATDLSRALICLIRNVQFVHFPLEIQCLLKGKQISKSSSVLNLSPFLDENSILRVGGRLKHSNLTVNQKHPMLIPNKGHISNLFINYHQVLHFHTSVESTLANISDPNDSILTPAHFLVGTSLTALPEPDLTNTPINRLNRWQLVQKLTQTFWKKWSNYYLHRLQSRVKWQRGEKPFKENELVLVKDEDF
ncbi:integrase catalytic domain-containing protein [Trichonephila clavipes]|nr:integrase catalytic domain-containing protein [Trichonephila clavipes]